MQHCDGEVREREREREVPLCARFQPGSPSVTPSHLAERVAAIKQGPPQIQNESKVPPRFSSISFRVRSAFGAAYARVLAWQSPTSRFAEPFALALVGLGDIFWDNGHCFLFFPLSLSPLLPSPPRFVFAFKYLFFSALELGRAWSYSRVEGGGYFESALCFSKVTNVVWRGRPMSWVLKRIFGSRRCVCALMG